ncbi:hypothetical protein EF903_06890 [Streptomyces sp. WAC05292]|uniref:hypothetical protein n=1 Tax=Streptomyces sp. WAC05292 TaxID=2487418 RepID=UPI000F73BDBA|nr:hypothetical protein [Streptomyces sp. WAC05292]RSS94258.1 hypothetical protein EF903_06890 [Streptomyces sp. WAC05292]
MKTLTPMERRPAPVDNDAKGSQHGAPALWGGELAGLLRDASFLNRPDTRRDKQVHVAVFSNGLNTRSGGQIGDLGAACNPTGIMLNDDLWFEARKVPRVSRCRRPACRSLFVVADRQHSDLEHIRSYYGLESRIGVKVVLGLRVRHAGRPGRIIDTAGQYLVVRLDDDPAAVKVHATAEMEYEGPEGWVRAVPLPDPYAQV